MHIVIGRWGAATVCVCVCVCVCDFHAQLLTYKSACSKLERVTQSYLMVDMFICNLFVIRWMACSYLGLVTDLLHICSCFGRVSIYIYIWPITCLYLWVGKHIVWLNGWLVLLRLSNWWARWSLTWESDRKFCIAVHAVCIIFWSFSHLYVHPYKVWM